MAGQRKIYIFIIPDPHPSPLMALVCEIIKHQNDFVKALGILDTNIYNTYICHPFFVYLLCFVFFWGGEECIHTYLREGCRDN